MAANSLDRAKQAVRTQVWDALTAADAIHDPSVHGRIPHFKGTEQAAARLATLPAWQRASIVKSVPDKAQLPVRTRALEEGKTVYMAVPKLATPKPFYLLDPATLTVPPTETAAGRTAAAIAPTVEVDALRPLDLIVLGSVAVNRDGARIGKGAGYSDIEVGDSPYRRNDPTFGVCPSVSQLGHGLRRRGGRGCRRRREGRRRGRSAREAPSQFLMPWTPTRQPR
ncbi:5-formyltetrahydrofolate cyclo-ligase [Streptomyces hirsutus]|uniref:5-formyltetrahydrofolate cyclo-ligase n=1 Tax=Streptomyces hirsutus TaxID=35620 RepID=UPI00332C0164